MTDSNVSKPESGGETEKPNEVLPAADAVGLGWLIKVLSASVAQVPYLKYAVGLVGVTTAAAIILEIYIFISNQLIQLGSVVSVVVWIGVMFVLMFILFLFSKFSEEDKKTFRVPALMIAWTTGGSVCGLVLLAASVGVFQRPTHLANLVFQREPTQVQNDIMMKFTDRNSLEDFRSYFLRVHINTHDEMETAINQAIYRFFLLCAAKGEDNPSGESVSSSFACISDARRARSSEMRFEPDLYPAKIWKVNALTDSASCNETIAAKRLREGTSGATQVKGVDMSHSEPADWGKIVDDGNVFVILKASEGPGFVDSTFVQRWNEAGKLGLLRGAYHVMRDSEPDSQIKNFLSVMRSVEIRPCDLGPALDIADGRPPPRNAGVYIAASQKWLNAVTQILKKPAFVYTSYSFFVEALGNPEAAFPETLLWIPRFGASPPLVPRVWRNYTLWQNSDGHSFGVPAGFKGPPLDTNIFRGSLEDFAKILNLEEKRS